MSSATSSMTASTASSADVVLLELTPVMRRCVFQVRSDCGFVCMLQGTTECFQGRPLRVQNADVEGLRTDQAPILAPAERVKLKRLPLNDVLSLVLRLAGGC